MALQAEKQRREMREGNGEKKDKRYGGSRTEKKAQRRRDPRENGKWDIYFYMKKITSFYR